MRPWVVAEKVVGVGRLVLEGIVPEPAVASCDAGRHTGFAKVQNGLFQRPPRN